jgi:hypothetical protein
LDAPLIPPLWGVVGLPVFALAHAYVVLQQQSTHQSIHTVRPTIR